MINFWCNVLCILIDKRVNDFAYLTLCRCIGCHEQAAKYKY